MMRSCSLRSAQIAGAFAPHVERSLLAEGHPAPPKKSCHHDPVRCAGPVNLIVREAYSSRTLGSE